MPFLGLAPFLRKSIAGEDLRVIAQTLLSQAQNHSEDPDLLLNLSIAMFAIEQRDLGLAIQAQALQLAATYDLPARHQPACCRLLMLMTPGDLAANTPLECLLENSDIDLIFHYLDPSQPTLDKLPAHDAIFVAPSESDENRPLLAWLDRALANFSGPVINAPGGIPSLARHTASQLLQGVSGLAMPTTSRLERGALEALAEGRSALHEIAPGHRFPLILRPVGSQAGKDLSRIAHAEALADYLKGVDAPRFYLADFIDYSGQDGLFRKFRIVLVDGQPFAGHMAVSEHWMVHYVNAGMYSDARRRDEEAAFMAGFDRFLQAHRDALQALHRRIGLDYLCIDCAETGNGDLLIFEVGNAMVVHAMDPIDTFPYKQEPMKRIAEAFRDLLLRRLAKLGSTTSREHGHESA